MASSPSIAAVSLLICLLLALSSALPSHSLINAAEILADSGYLSMALTLEVVSQSLVPRSPSLTIFAPPDSAFKRSGQPSLSLLQLHFAPLALPLQTLTSLPAGTKIPTLRSGNSLVVTSGSQTSLNGVRVTTAASPIYDDGFLIILGVEDFFDPKFQPPAPPRPSSPPSGQKCGSDLSNGSSPGASWLQEARGALKSNGYSATASFLALQLIGFKNSPTPLTVFAPVDQALENPLLDPSVFLRHVVPCRLRWSDLVGLSEGTVLPTYLDGFTIRISKSGDVLLLNGAPVYFPDMYSGEFVAVHGLRESLEMPEESDAGETSPDDESEF